MRALRRLWSRKEAGEPDAAALNACLDHPELPDPDLIIRTSGELRMSNFLLWQAAYAELYFSDKLFPDWDGDDLVAALSDYAGRSRRFGGAT